MDCVNLVIVTRLVFLDVGSSFTQQYLLSAGFANHDIFYAFGTFDPANTGTSISVRTHELMVSYGGNAIIGGASHATETVVVDIFQDFAVPFTAAPFISDLIGSFHDGVAPGSSVFLTRLSSTGKRSHWLDRLPQVPSFNQPLQRLYLV